MAAGEGIDNKAMQRGFQANKNTLYDNIMIDTFHFAFIQTHRMSNTKSKLCTRGDYNVSVQVHQL